MNNIIIIFFLIIFNSDGVVMGPDLTGQTLLFLSPCIDQHMDFHHVGLSWYLKQEKLE